MGTTGDIDDRLLDAEGASDADEGRTDRCDGVDTSAMGTEHSSYDDPCNGTKGDGCNARCGSLAYRRDAGCLAVPADLLAFGREGGESAPLRNFPFDPPPCR